MAFLARTSSRLSRSLSRLASVRGVSSKINGITIEHTSLGNTDAPPVLLIMGHSGTMTQWKPIDERLAAAGFHVIMFNNRDMGNTQRFDDVLPDAQKHIVPGSDEAKSGKIAYCAEDMADDAVAVLDHYGIAKAHIMGISMGGLLTQIVGVKHGSRCKSLCPIMTSTAMYTSMAKSAAKDGGQWMQKFMEVLTTSGASPDDTLEEFLAKKRRWMSPILSDPSWPEVTDEMWARQDEIFTIDFQRKAVDDGNGSARHTLAVSNYETKKLEAHIEGLKNISCPTLVLHGVHDPLIPVEDARELMQLIPGARMVEYLGGHYFGNHPTVENTFLAAVVEHLTAAEKAA